MGLESKIPEFIAELEARVHAAELAAAELVVDAAKERVAVDPNAKTHLRDAIHVEETDDGVLVVAGDKEHWYGHILEHGSVKMPAQPFLIPALEENADRIVEDIRAEIGRTK